MVPNGSCKRNSNQMKENRIPKSSSSYENTPNVDSMEHSTAEKGGEETPNNSQQMAVMLDEVEEDSGRGSASTPLAVNFRSRYTLI